MSPADPFLQAYENLRPPHRPPPCPLDVNIIHYTNFLYGIHCQVRHSGNAILTLDLNSLCWDTHKFCGSRSTNLTEDDAGLVRLCSKCVNAQ